MYGVFHLKMAARKINVSLVITKDDIWSIFSNVFVYLFHNFVALD